MCVNVRTYICMYVYVCMCVYVGMCVYIYIYSDDYIKSEFLGSVRRLSVFASFKKDSCYGHAKTTTNKQKSRTNVIAAL